MVEANESPIDAARRELLEELGIRPEVRGVLLMNWDPPHGPWDDQLVLIFDGGELGPAGAAGLRPHDHELSACAFFSPDDAVAAVRPRIRERVAQAVEALVKGEIRYLQSGHPLW